MSSGMLDGAEQGPMNAMWFYNQNNPYKQANELHQDRKWKDAADRYKQILDANAGDDYDQNMAKLNLAACSMAQRQSTEHWSSFDVVLGIPEQERISLEQIDNAHSKEEKVVLVRTDKVGIGDIFHFFSTAHELKKRTGWNVVVSVRNFLKGPLSDAAEGYGLKLVGERDEQPKAHHTTHIIGLLGLLKMDPADMAPEKVMFAAPERAMIAVDQQISPVLAQGKTLAVVFLGENRQATLIGGKQLPRDITKHGRHLSSEPFKVLLRKHPELVLMDCGGKDSRVAIDEDQQNQYMVIPEEQQPFDTTLALALAMNVNKKIIGFGADNGPTNVLARALNKAAQRRMALIIPNGGKETGEYDMRMEGEGSVYTQMISNCSVYKCETPVDQTEVIEKAYQTMTDEKVDLFPQIAVFTIGKEDLHGRTLFAH